MRAGYRDEEQVKLSPEKEAALVKRLIEFSEQPTSSQREMTAEEVRMISVSRTVRKKRGSWWQLPKNHPAAKPRAPE